MLGYSIYDTIIVQSADAETLMTDRPDRETTRQFLGRILGNARRMQELVDDLLDLSRIESGRWQPARSALDVEAVAREAWAALAARSLAAFVGSGFPNRVAFVRALDGQITLGLRGGLEILLGAPVDLRLKIAIAGV